MSMPTGVLTFLGTGASMGVPIPGCPCEVCHSDNPLNRRYRSSILCRIDGKNILIDCGPDFRSQALKNHIRHVDGVIFTHAHNDHTAGVDDLKVYGFLSGSPIPCLLSKETYEDLKRRFYYLFEGEEGHNPSIKMRFDMHLLEKDRGRIDFVGVDIHYFSYEQMGMKVNGFRIGRMAYVTDIRHYPDSIFTDLKGVDILIVSALKFGPSPMHFNIDEAIEFAKKVGASKTWFIHIAHDLDHEKTNAYLPENIRLAYDGLHIEF